MSGPDAANATERARTGVEQAEAGEPEGARTTEDAEQANAPAAEAAEQEAADGPEGRGLSR